MKQILLNQFTMLVLSMVSIMVSAGERQMWTDGHGDLQVGYQDGQWDWGVWIDSPVDEVIVSLGDAAKAFIPDNPNFEFLGNYGDPVWIAPQVDREGVIFFGMNSSSTSQGTFERNRFDLRLTSVEGPGDFLMWITGGAGSVEVPLNSRDGIDLADRVDVPAPGHFHQNWGFTSPGTYHVGFTGEGTLAGQSTLTTSDEQLYRFAVNVFDRGELDMEVAYEDGEWELVLLEEANEKEIEAGDAALHAGPATWQAVPSDPAFGFLGNPGDSIYILPQDEKEGVLFLGIAGDEIEAGVFENDQVSLNLSIVDGPGSVYLYSTDAFGAPSKYFDSGDGITGTDQFPVNVGGHSHQNWAFSSPGIYRVGLNASGVLMDGTQTRSEDTVFLFEVFGPTIFGEGELDLEVAFEDGAWELVGLDDANEREIRAEELVIRGSNATQTVVPEDPAFAFLGSAGDTVNVLPQEETEGVIFLGIAGDEIEAGTFDGDVVQLKLISTDGPGHVSLYAVDAFGSPEVYFNTGDGISESDAFPVNVGGHSHQNWGFTQPGVYRVGLQASGQLAGSGEASMNDVVLFTFDIQATAPMMFGEGEIDLEVAYGDGEWELVLLDEVNEKEIEAGDAILHANPETWQAVPSDPAFGFLGNPGDSIYILPQDEQEGVLFLGIAGDEIEAGVFENDQVSLNLSSVSGPGAVYLYSTDAFGAPTTYFDSSNGISEEDFFPVSVGGHSHQNWAFSSPGAYRVGLNASGVLADGTPVRSGDTEFSFEVQGPTIFGEGELDLEVAFEDGEWELVGLDEVN
ncbi:MAG: choice-of-anchor M domain-containing protein, partial [Verrucomicrobiota bacterium]|nr:choice-of-anchor M domain-containing protein [Verrucomicrobiota bacterium]